MTRNDLRRWRAAGWLSFEVDAVAQLDEPHKKEIMFVRSLALSGLGQHEIQRMVQGLGQPLAFDSRYIAYNFEYGWVEPVEQDPYEVTDEHVLDWLEHLASIGNADKLQMLREKIAGHLDGFASEEDDRDEPG